MVVLSAADYEGVLDLVVDVARNGVDGEPLPPPALARIRRLIPTADTVADWIGSPGPRRHAAAVDGDYLAWTPGEDRLAERLAFADPLLPRSTSIGRVRRLSDEIEPAAYRATEFYRRLGRLHGLEYSIAAWLMPADGSLRGLWLDAAAHDFDDHDVAVLQLIVRQLSRLSRSRRRTPRQPRMVGPAALTDRQAEILALAAVGRSNEEIARDLSISPNTVRTHLENVFERLQVHTRAAAVGRAWELGILPRVLRPPA